MGNLIHSFTDGVRTEFCKMNQRPMLIINNMDSLLYRVMFALLIITEMVP